MLFTHATFHKIGLKRSLYILNYMRFCAHLECNWLNARWVEKFRTNVMRKTKCFYLQVTLGSREN
jgi:hypothetical protein